MKKEEKNFDWDEFSKQEFSDMGKEDKKAQKEFWEESESKGNKSSFERS